MQSMHWSEALFCFGVGNVGGGGSYKFAYAGSRVYDVAGNLSQYGISGTRPKSRKLFFVCYVFTGYCFALKCALFGVG